MKVKSRTPAELVQIYSLDQEGKTTRYIAQEVGISPGVVGAALRTLEKYLKGTARTQARQSNSYKIAAKIIRKQRSSRLQQPTLPHEAPVPPEAHRPEVALWPATPPVDDPFAFLRSSFDTFQQAVATFIEVEISSRYKALQDEIRVLREENEQFKQKLAEPQSINWIDTLEENLPKETQ